jgi:cytochrome c oxidase assembly protein subunit 15
MVLLAAFGVRARGRFSTAPALRLRYRVLVGLVAANGVIGIVQYLLKVPDVMVPFHVLGAVLITAVGAALSCAARDRGPAPPPAPSNAAQPGVAAQAGSGGPANPRSSGAPA